MVIIGLGLTSGGDPGGIGFVVVCVGVWSVDGLRSVGPGSSSSKVSRVRGVVVWGGRSFAFCGEVLSMDVGVGV